MRRSVVVVLVFGLAATVTVALVVLSHKPLTVIGNNSIPGKQYIELEEKGRLGNCQSAGTIPRGTSAIRLAIEGIYYSPAVSVKVWRGSRVIREGSHGAGGPAVPNVSVPIAPLVSTVEGARVCTIVGPAFEPIRFSGLPSRSAVPQSNPLQQAVLHIDYLRVGPRSWWSLLTAAARHLGLGRAPSGLLVVFLVLLLMLAVISAVSWLVVNELR